MYKKVCYSEHSAPLTRELSYVSRHTIWDPVGLKRRLFSSSQNIRWNGDSHIHDVAERSGGNFSISSYHSSSLMTCLNKMCSYFSSGPERLPNCQSPVFPLEFSPRTDSLLANYLDDTSNITMISRQLINLNTKLCMSSPCFGEKLDCWG